MSPRVKADDLILLRPRVFHLVEPFHGWLGGGVIGFVQGVEGADGNCERAVDGIGTAVRADSVAEFDGGREARADDGATLGGGDGAPAELVRVDS
jgi:hypothetical protein